jgi:hypothetical protein
MESYLEKKIKPTVCPSLSNFTDNSNSQHDEVKSLSKDIEFLYFWQTCKSPGFVQNITYAKYMWF